MQIVFFSPRRRAILANTDVSGGAPWHRSFANDFWGTPLTDSGSHGSWRPFCVLSFRLNHLMAGGYVPWGFHLVNNLLHCVATALVVRVARSLLASFWAVLAAGTLFAVHPIHTEAVASVVGRADVAACVCYLLTYLSYLRHMRWRESADPRQWVALSATLFFAVMALLCKETAVTALLVCAAFDVIRGLSGQVDKVSLVAANQKPLSIFPFLPFPSSNACVLSSLCWARCSAASTFVWWWCPVHRAPSPAQTIP